MHVRSGAIFLLMFTIYFASSAQSYKNSIQGVTENDAYIDITKDRYYTNGIFINYTTALRNDSLNKKLLHINLVQKIFNPYYSTAPNPSLHDRPFGAFLYGEAGITKFSNRHVIKYYGQLGLIGNRSLGENFQKFYHNLVGQNKIDGWDYALKADLGINVGVIYTTKLFGTPDNLFDAFGIGQATVGSFETKANVGALMRIGKLNNMENSASFASRVGTDGKRTPYELFFFVKPQLNFVAFDSSLQGGLFRNDKGPVTFRPKPFTFSPQVGATFAIQRWVLNYTVTYTTKEVKSNAPDYKYAAISAAYSFN